MCRLSCVKKEGEEAEGEEAEGDGGEGCGGMGVCVRIRGLWVVGCELYVYVCLRLCYAFSAVK